MRRLCRLQSLQPQVPARTRQHLRRRCRLQSLQPQAPATTRQLQAPARRERPRTQPLRPRQRPSRPSPRTPRAPFQHASEPTVGKLVKGAIVKLTVARHTELYNGLQGKIEAVPSRGLKVTMLEGRRRGGGTPAFNPKACTLVAGADAPKKDPAEASASEAPPQETDGC